MEYFGPADFLLVWVLDAIIGDPSKIAHLHPITLIGRAATVLEKNLYRENHSPYGQKNAGMKLWLLLVPGAFAAAWLFIGVMGFLHPVLGKAAALWLGWSCIATRQLDREVRLVAGMVLEDHLGHARKRLAMIVGRDTDGMDAPEVYRAALETAAENSSDGVTAPLIFLALGGLLGVGPALGIAYKAVNTLDSMVGYKNERYLFFGSFSARMDDLFNYLPARWTGYAAALLCPFFGGDRDNSLRAIKSDARKHASPNAGYPEAAFAGAFNVRLGGLNRYGGVEKMSPLINEGGATPGYLELNSSLKLVWALSVATVLGSYLLWIAFAG
jgi:adenosylcobinamide-phosphate synthase